MRRKSMWKKIRWITSGQHWLGLRGAHCSSVVNKMAFIKGIAMGKEGAEA